MAAASLQQAHNRSNRRQAEAGNGALEQDGEIQTTDKEVSAIAEKVFAGGEATLEESKNLAAYVLGQDEKKAREA
jgi:hypothetical protein